MSLFPEVKAVKLENEVKNYLFLLLLLLLTAHFSLIYLFFLSDQTVTLIKTVSSPVRYVSFAVQCEQDRRQWLGTLYEPE